MSVDATVGAPAAIDAEPLGGWRKMLADTLLVGGATLCCHALGAVTSLVMRGLIDPAQMGVWQGLKIFLNYANYANLGISKGATQELAMANGRGDIAVAQRGLNLAHSVNTLTSVLYAAVLFIAAALVWWRDENVWSRTWAVGLALIGLLAIVQRHVTFQVTMLRALREFGVTTRLQMIEAVMTLAVSALAIWLWGLWGLFVATLLVLATSWIFLRQTDVPVLAWEWDWPEIRRLVRLGGPILMAGVASSLFRSLDKLLILGCFADKEYQLGCYSLTLLVGAQLYGLANMLSTVMGPRYSELLGRTQSRRDVARLAARASEMQAALMLLPALLGLLAAPLVLDALLPAYADGLPPLVWMVPAVLATGLALPGSQFLIATERAGHVLAAAVAAMGVAAALGLLAVHLGGGLVGISAAMLGGNAFYLTWIGGLLLGRELRLADRVRYVGVLTATIGGSVLTAVATQSVLDEPLSPRQAAFFSMLLLMAIGGWSAMVRWGWRHGGWQEACRKRVPR